MTFPSSAAGLTSVTATFVIDGEGAGGKGDSSPRSGPGAGSRHSRSPPVCAACSLLASLWKRAGAGRRLGTRWQAPTSSSGGPGEQSRARMLQIVKNSSKSRREAPTKIKIYYQSNSSMARFLRDMSLTGRY